jgi:serine phosphatase RsbU (regulator of sigma subunit)
LTGDALILRLTIDGMGTMMAVVCGYVALAMFLAVESAAFLRIRAEMALAQEIHRTLVPAVAGRTDRFEFAGASHPSGEVGGDLVDVFTEPDGNRSIAYVADVSGHGVDAGVVMGLVKSAARMALIRRAPLEELVRDLNEVLVPLTSSSMYVTAAVVEASPLGFRFALAGHWPILHVRDNGRTIDEGTVQNLPLGFFAGQSYATASLTCRSGDLLALITDGFVEVFDRDDREFGLEAVKQVLSESADRSLPDVLSALRLAVQAHGAQIDDQSALLLRVIH